MNNLLVTNRGGDLEPLNIKKIQKKTTKATAGLEGVSSSELELSAGLEMFSGIKTTDIQKTLIMTAVSKIDIDSPNWTFVAARLYLEEQYHTVGRLLSKEKGNPYPHLQDYLDYGSSEKAQRINKTFFKKYSKEEINQLNKVIQSGIKDINGDKYHERDYQFNYLGMKTFFDRYALKDIEGNVFELPQLMFMALSMFLAQNEEDKIGWSIKFYNMISKFEVMLATPTLSNGRTERNQLSSCYVGATPDNIEGIFDSYRTMALLSKYGGGIGWDWHDIRSAGGDIDNNKGVSGGTVPFLKIANDEAIAVDQLGTRKGSIAVYIEPWHMDIEAFLDLKKNSGEERLRAHDLFPALWIPDLFMDRVEKDEDYTLFDPSEVPHLHNLYGEDFEKAYIEAEKNDKLRKIKVSAKDIWKKILTSYFETGSPFLNFKDNANKRNQNSHVGIIRSSNLCVTGDTRLHTQFGLVKAKELYEMESEILATYDKRVCGNLFDIGTETAACIQMHKTAKQADIYEIKTKDGYTIKSTDWHEYYVNRNGNLIKIPLNEINIETDKLLVQSGEGQFGSEGIYELGLIAGFVAGDGTFSISRDKKQQIHIELYNEDIKYSKDKIINSLAKVESHFGITTKKKESPKEFWHTKNSKKIRISSINIGELFRNNFNFTKDTKLNVPEFVFKGTKETVIGYLQGLFTSDGTVNIIKNNNIETFAIQLGSISKELLEDVQILLSNFGIRSKISKMREIQENIFEYETVNGEKRSYSSKSFFRLNLNENNAINFIDKIGFIGEKQEKANIILKNRILSGYEITSRKREYFEVKIISIDFIGKEDVYDTTQLLNHSLIFNGLVTGNCTEIFQNTKPAKYGILLEFDSGESLTFEEDELLDIFISENEFFKKKAKKVNSIDTIKFKDKLYKVVFSSRIVLEEEETAVCNLASVNLSKINTKEDFERVVPIAIRALDNVIDLNYYPVKSAMNTNKKSRAIGLGVMGEAQMLAEAGIQYGTEEHFQKIDEVMEIYSYNVIKSSALLGKEKGSYPQFEDSNWSKGILHIDSINDNANSIVIRHSVYDWNELRSLVRKAMRNGYLMAVAPTSTISILTGTTTSTESIYKRKWFEENLSGLIPVTAPNLSPDTWTNYVPVYDLDQLVVIKAAAIRQKWLDQGQSINIFIRLDKASGKYFNEIYMLAWKLGLKSTYYLRSQSPEVAQEMDVNDRSFECSGCQ